MNPKNSKKIIKNDLYRSFLREGTQTSEYRYKTCKNKLTSILRLAEKAYYSKMLLEKRGNIKETWAILNTTTTVEPLSNDHPHQRPSLLYDHMSCDGQCFLFVRSLTNDHPSDATSDWVRWYLLPRGRPHRVF